MTKNQAIAEKTDFSRKSEKGDLPERRKTENLPDGLYYFEDELKTEQVLEANVITSAGWLLELVKLDAGEISFFSETQEIRPHFKQLAIFYPPFTITRPCFKCVIARLKGIAGTSALPAEFLSRPFIFEADFAASPKTTAEVVDVLSSRRNIQFIDANPKASLLSLKAKKLIDENYRIFPSIARIAARLQVSHEHLTRQFKKDFRQSPSVYLHQIRIADATFRLSQGEAIIEVSGDVGYNDLSRFYKQFRKSTRQSPGFCQTSRKVE
jgi:AraC-like DNA-binding protein